MQDKLAEVAKANGNEEAAKSENAKLAAENAKFSDQIEEFEQVRSEWEKKASEMRQRISELIDDKERLAGGQSARGSEIERLVDSERAKNAQLTGDMNTLTKGTLIVILFMVTLLK